MSGRERFRIKFAVYLIARRDNNILLSRRYNTGYMDGFYGLVSGHVDGGETADEALIREVQEEAGLTLERDSLKLVYTLHRLKNTPDEEYIDLFFECDNWSGEFINNEPHKCDDLSWYSLDELPENTLPYIKDVLRGYLAGEIYGSSRGEV